MGPRDILAQQIVATVAAGERSEQEMLALARRAYPYRDLDGRTYQGVLEMLAEGVATGRGRRSAHLHWDRINGRLRARRGARLAAITNGGAIPDVADYLVIEDPAGTHVGTVNEDFAVESLAGDIFLLGNRSWRIRRIEAGKVRVEDARGAPPTVPFWLGEAPARTQELSAAVAALRQAVADGIRDIPGTVAWLQAEAGLDQAGAEQFVAYVSETLGALGVVPTQHLIVAERFFDEAGGMQMVVHAPFGARINRAWGLLLRKRFCLTFDFELQAAATDDGIVLSLGQQHSFPLETVFAMVHPDRLEEDLVQAILQAPMFGTRWRWNATRALALLRHSGGRRVPMPLQRMRADDLLAAVFPAQVACQDNHPGPITPPSHPLVDETLENCMREAMDLEGLRSILGRIRRGEIRTLTVDTPVPSPMSHEILNANPYAFLDDAPLEERRARAVSLRRVDANLAGGVGALDQAAITEVRAQAWPDVRGADELHDTLLSLVLVPTGELGGWRAWIPELLAAGRIVQVTWSREPRAPARQRPPGRGRTGPGGESREDQQGCGRRQGTGAAAQRGTGAGEQGGQIRNPRSEIRNGDGGREEGYAATERMAMVRAALPDVTVVSPPPIVSSRDATGEPRAETTEDRGVAAEDGVRAIVLGWMEALGPTTVPALAGRLGLQVTTVETAMAALEAGGVVLRGRFTPGLDPATTEWCERRLLARIHRLTIGRLRRQIEPVSPADFMRYLFRWQHVFPGSQLHGRDGITSVIGMLQGMELPAPAWERDVLPARVARYSGADLEQLCLSGVVAWARLRLREDARDHTEGDLNRRRRQGPARSASLGLVLRQDLPHLVESGGIESLDLAALSPVARAVGQHLQARGASFLGDIAKAIGQLESRVEDALWELVSRGVVTGDGIAGLRVLLAKGDAKREPHRRFRSLRGGLARVRHVPVGRWALLRHADDPGHSRKTGAETEELLARQLLRRYGVVLREVLARETRAPSWRRLVEIYRRWEARGEVRGGRFIDGFSGEQFALPEAVEALRAVRSKSDGREAIVIAAADPLNLAGILTPGNRVSPLSGLAILYVDGVPVEIGEPHRLRALRPAQDRPFDHAWA
jgi:ATP-dependent Lhr-like helicase